MNDISVTQLLKAARRLAKDYQARQLENGIKIAVLGSYSIQHFVMVLRYMLHQEGIISDIYEGNFNSIPGDILKEDSSLYQYQPNIIILLNQCQDIMVFPQLLGSEEEVKACIDNHINYYKMIWEALSRIPYCHILQTNYVIPPIRSLGNLEANYSFSETNFYRRLNLELIRQKSLNVSLIDLDTLASNYGKYNWFDYSAYFLYKLGFRMEYLGVVADLFVSQIKAIIGLTRKCLVLDLDNTLWGGIVGDDGCYGINLDSNNPIGEAYRFFQQYITKLKQRGVILAVCSKNEDSVAREPFLKNNNMILKLEDIACFVANWEDKVNNIRRIAGELNIGLDSLVFFDDNPAERELVRKYLPEVQVVDVPEEPAYYALSLERAMPFEWLQLTPEDLSRSTSYYENRQRAEIRKSYIDYKDYLDALDMRAEVGYAGKEQLERVVQLINKTNQFNLTAKPYNYRTVEQMSEDNTVRLLFIHLKDKYSDFGVISCAIVRKVGQSCYIDTWVMSCRVFQRGVEDLMFRAIIDAAIELECIQVIGEYIKTKRNGMVETLYPELGFDLCVANNTELGFPDNEGQLYVYHPLIKPNKALYIEKMERVDEKI